MPNAYKSVQDKVRAIFTEVAGDRAKSLDGPIFCARVKSTITNALTQPNDEDAEISHADEVAFHLTDWNGDAAFLVALHLYPEKFKPEEIKAGIDSFLVHVPAHVIAAARLTGNSTEDIFSDDHGAPVTLDSVRAKRDEILRLAEKYRTSNVRVFGSTARGDAKRGSDLDLLVDTLPGCSLFDLGGLAEDLKELFGIKVDVAVASDLKEDARDAVFREAIPL